MRHRAPRRLLAVLRRRRVSPLHRHLGTLAARPSARVLGAMSAVLLLTGSLAAATALYDGAQAGDPSADRLRSALRPSRGGDRTPPPSAPTPTLQRRPSEAPASPTRADRPARTADRASHTARPTRPTHSESLRPRPSPTLPTRPSLPTDDVPATADVEPTDPVDRATRSPAQDGVAPQTSVVSGPSQEDDDTPLEFTASEPATFDCSLDGGAFRSCSSPAEYDDVGAGWHTVEVRAVDRSGNRDASPDAWRWHAERADEHQEDQEHDRGEDPAERLLPDGDVAPCPACT